MRSSPPLLRCVPQSRSPTRTCCRLALACGLRKPGANTAGLTPHRLGLVHACCRLRAAAPSDGVGMQQSKQHAAAGELPMAPASMTADDNRAPAFGALRCAESVTAALTQTPRFCEQVLSTATALGSDRRRQSLRTSPAFPQCCPTSPPLPTFRGRRSEAPRARSRMPPACPLRWMTRLIRLRTFGAHSFPRSRQWQPLLLFRRLCRPLCRLRCRLRVHRQ